MNIENLITHIKKRPKMFIPSLEIKELYFFILGFLTAKKTNNVMEEIDILFDNEINGWIINKLNYQHHYSNWCSAIEESVSEDKFFTAIEYFEEWLSEKKM